MLEHKMLVQLEMQIQMQITKQTEQITKLNKRGSDFEDIKHLTIEQHDNKNKIQLRGTG